MHLKLTNGTPAKYTLGQLRRDNPQTSFPKLIPDDLLASYNVYPYTRPAVPEYNGLTQRLTDGEFERVDGAWFLPYVVTDMPLEDQIENLKAARAQAYTQEADPLFFKWQRGEVNKSEWSDKVQEIRDRFPYPDEPAIN
jgi:hypothetical protein